MTLGRGLTPTSSWAPGLKAGRRVAATMLVAAPLAYLGYLFLYPLLSVLWVSLTGTGKLDLSPFWEIAA